MIVLKVILLMWSRGQLTPITKSSISCVLCPYATSVNQSSPFGADQGIIFSLRFPFTESLNLLYVWSINTNILQLITNIRLKYGCFCTQMALYFSCRLQVGEEGCSFPSQQNNMYVVLNIGGKNTFITKSVPVAFQGSV